MGGIGLERVVMLFLALGNIRWATLYPRDPRSFPVPEKAPAAAAAVVPGAETSKYLSGPRADTVAYAAAIKAGQHVSLPTLEDLIAACMFSSYT